MNAVQNLNERLLAIEEKVDDEKLNDLKDITETQGMIDALIVKNSDDITRLIKQKTENNEIIRSLETKIDMLKENELKNMMNQNSLIKCKYFYGGFCKMGNECIFVHNDKMCESFQKEGICILMNCKIVTKGFANIGNEEIATGEILANTNTDKNTDKKCELCDNQAYYYLEFCRKDICYNTVEKAHENDAYESHEMLCCKDIHKGENKVLHIVNEHMEVTNVEESHDDANVETYALKRTLNVSNAENSVVKFASRTPRR